MTLCPWVKAPLMLISNAWLKAMHFNCPSFLCLSPCWEWELGGDGSSFMAGLSHTAGFQVPSFYIAVNLCASLRTCKTYAFATLLIRPESRSTFSPVLLNILFSDITSQINLRWLMLIFNAVLYVRAETSCVYRGSVSFRMKEHYLSCSENIYFVAHI